MNEKTLPLIKTAYITIVVCFCLVFGVGILIMTVEPDEVWNLMSTMKAFGLALPPTTAVDNPVITTGGLHFVLHGLVALVWGADILAHRIVSVGAMLILLAVVYKVIENRGGDRFMAIAGVAIFVTAPGFLLQVSLATSEIIATLIFLLAAMYWVGFGGRSAGTALFGGVLFGLACATRMTCISMLPAIVVWSILIQKEWSKRCVYPLLAVAVALLVFAGFMAIYFYAFGASSWNDYLRLNGMATGLGRPSSGFIFRLNYLTVGDGIVPIIAITALAGWLVSSLRAENSNRELIGLCGFLFLAGAAGWAAWVFKAPIPHIRYLWPAIPMLWLTAILLGASAFGRLRQERTVMISHLVIIGICATQGLLNVRMLAVGDSLGLVYEMARGSKLATPKGFFEARRNQNEMVTILVNLPPSATIYALSDQAAYPMTYLSMRTVKSLKLLTKASPMDYLLVQHSDHSIWGPRWDVIAWIQNNTTLVYRRGDYELYRVREGVFFPSLN